MVLSAEPWFFFHLWMNQSLYITPYHNLCELHWLVLWFCSVLFDWYIDVVVVQAAAPPSPHQEKTTATSASWPFSTTILAKTCPGCPCQWLSMSRCLCCRGSVKSWNTQTCSTSPTTSMIHTREWCVWLIASSKQMSFSGKLILF